MNIPRSIIDNLALHLETEIEAGRRLVPLDPEVVSRFLALPAGDTPARRPLRRPTPSPHPTTPETCPLPPPPLPQPLPRFASMEALAKGIAACEQCPLSQGRSRTFPGEGPPQQPDILFVGDKPSAEEAATGRPFEGSAGELLTDMITAMGYARGDVFVTTLTKCPPPKNRPPTRDEIKTCLPWLHQQIERLKPACIVTLGDAALAALQGDPTLKTNKARGMWRAYRGIPLMPTLHPDRLIQAPHAKREVWEDLKTVLKRLGRTPPPIKKRNPPGHEQS